MSAELNNSLGIALALRPIRNVLRFSGRSTRTEVVAFSVLYFILAALASLAVIPFTSFESSNPTFTTLRVILGIPFVALFARRLQDQNRSAIWTPLLAALPTIWILQETILRDQLNTITGWTLSLTFLLSATNLLVLYLFFAPPSEGDKRYGSDPRL